MGGQECPHELSGKRSEVYVFVRHESEATHVGSCVRCHAAVYMRRIEYSSKS